MSEPQMGPTLRRADEIAWLAEQRGEQDKAFDQRLLSIPGIIGLVLVIALPVSAHFLVSRSALVMVAATIPGAGLIASHAFIKKATKDVIEAQSDLMNPLGVAESPSVRIRMINGIQNSLHYARETARWLAKSAQYPVHYTYNPSNSFFTDMWECLTMMRGKMVSSVDRTVSELARQIIADAKSVDTPVFVAHSQGVMILNRALESASTLTENWDALKKKIRIYTYGGPEVVEDTGYQKVKNYQGSHDPISRFTPKETSAPIKVARPTVPPRGIPFDHGIRGPSYGELLTRKMRKLTVPGGG